MQLQVSPEDQVALEEMVSAGKFDSVEEALHAAITDLRTEPESHWLSYARNAI